MTLFAGLVVGVLVVAACVATLLFCAVVFVLLGGMVSDHEDFQLAPKERRGAVACLWAVPLFVALSSLVVEWLAPISFWVSGS